MWHVIQPNPELRKYRLLFAVTRPPRAVFSHEDYGEAAREASNRQSAPSGLSREEAPAD